jgi:hypothetical protein
MSLSGTPVDVPAPQRAQTRNLYLQWSLVPLVFPNSRAQAACADRKFLAIWTARTNGKLDAPLPLRLWHLASLDAPTVAAVWVLAFAWAAKVRLPAGVVVSIALVVWSVYVADRLLDARKGLRRCAVEGLRARHFFHWRRRRILVPLGIASALTAAWLILPIMPVFAYRPNSVLAVAAFAYFTRVHLRRETVSGQEFARRVARFLSPIVSKELLVGVLFAAGCALPTWNRVAHRSWPLIVSVAFFAALAWMNCHAIEQWESAAREARIDQAASALCLAGVLLAGVLGAVFIPAAQPRAAALLLAGAAAALMLAILDFYRGRLTPLALRASADLVLLTPLALILR